MTPPKTKAKSSPDPTEPAPDTEEPAPPAPEAEAAPPSPPPAPGAPAPPEAPDWERNYRYLLADFDNFRKRVEREREQAVRNAQGRLLLRIIDLHEGIERVTATLPREATPIREGLSLLIKNLDALLRNEGVEPLAQVGGVFSLETHEAVGSVPAPSGVAEGRIALIVQQGYRGPGGLLRPAKVLLAAAPAGTEPAGPDEPKDDTSATDE